LMEFSLCTQAESQERVQHFPFLCVRWPSRLPFADYLLSDMLA